MTPMEGSEETPSTEAEESMDDVIEEAPLVDDDSGTAGDEEL